MESRDGVRYSELLEHLKKVFPGDPPNTLGGSIRFLRRTLPPTIIVPERGIYRAVAVGEHSVQPVTPKISKAAVREDEFYLPFANWLVGELEECTNAVPLGGNRFGGKWGTPDVIGIREPAASDIIKPPIEVVAAEIKTDTAGLITAFGQACAYKLFAHKSYIVIPATSPKGDIERLDSLAMIFGIGLILLNPESPESPDFDILVRAQRHEPDMFYVNKYLKDVEKDLFR